MLLYIFHSILLQNSSLSAKFAMVKYFEEIHKRNILSVAESPSS